MDMIKTYLVNIRSQGNLSQERHNSYITGIHLERVYYINIVTMKLEIYKNG